MRDLRTLRRVILCFAAAALFGCGGGGTGDEPAQPPRTTVLLKSDAGDYIGLGLTYSYTQANAVVTMTASGAHLSVSITGDQQWSGDFQITSGVNTLQVGSYDVADPTKGRLSWFGDGRGCTVDQGSFTIDSVTYLNGALASMQLRFTQQCQGTSAALHGEIHWFANDSTAPPGPLSPPPAGLWQPSPGSTPATGNYVYLESDPGDYIGL